MKYDLRKFLIIWKVFPALHIIRKTKSKQKTSKQKKKPDYKLVCVYILLQKFNKDGFRENVHKKTHNNRLAGYLVFFYLSV